MFGDISGVGFTRDGIESICPQLLKHIKPQFGDWESLVVKLAREHKHPLAFDRETIFVPGHIGGLAIVRCKNKWIDGQVAQQKGEKCKEMHDLETLDVVCSRRSP